MSALKQISVPEESQLDSLKILSIRLGPVANEMIRDKYQLRGDLVKIVRQALETEDLLEVPVYKARRAYRSSNGSIVNTTVQLKKAMIGHLRNIALERGVSMNSLLNSTIVAYMKKHP